MGRINLDFDLTPVADEFQLSNTEISQMSESVSKAVTLEIHRNWIEAAKRDLNSTRNSYINGLVVSDEGGGVNSITLTGTLNNMIEEGVSAFDMKTGFMKSDKIKYSKTGAWYLTIPFRFATPGALGENEAFSGVLPQEIYDLVKNFNPQKTDAGGNKSSADSLSSKNIPSEYSAPRTRKSVINEILNKTFDSYTHKSSIYAGIQRSEKTYEKGTQSTYNSFRRVGKNSDNLAWIHSGLQRRDFAKNAVENTDAEIIIENTVDKFLSELGF